MKTMYYLPIRLYGLLLLMGALTLAFITNTRAQSPIPPVNWQRILDQTAAPDPTVSLVRSADGGCAIVSTASTSSITKLSAEGTVEWTTPLYSNSVNGYYLQAMSDGGFLVLESLGGDPMLLERIGPTGTVIYRKYLDLQGLPTSRSYTYGASGLIATPDGGFLVSGIQSIASMLNPDNFSNILLLKLDKDGNTTWVKRYLGDGSTSLTGLPGVSVASEGGYLVHSTTTAKSITGSTDKNFSVIYNFRVDEQGTIVWQRIGSPSATFFDFASTADGYVATGTYTGLSGLTVLKLNRNLDVIKATRLADTYPENASYRTSIKPTPDGGCIVVDSYAGNGRDYRITKFNSELNIDWQEKGGGRGDDYARKVIVNPDGTYFISGTTNSPDFPDRTDNSTNTVIWVRKQAAKANTQALTLIAPTYNCTTGAITFNTTGGNGSTITYFAPGITGPTTNPNQFVDAGLRQAADAQPLTLSATQSGVTVTYRFDLRATCPIGTNPPVQTNTDRAILVEFYNATNGLGWINKTNWLQGDSPCNWFGVTCDGNNRVTGLSLGSNKLAGTLPASLGDLSGLQVLDMPNNQLSGPIPVTLGSLARVNYFDLSRNQLSGSIPANLGNLLNAITLYLYDNQLSGSIPASLGNLPNIQFLLLYNNQLTGSIPASFGNLTNLRNLRIDKNQLSGCFPVELANLCGKGAYIDMSSNPGLPGGGDFASFCSNRTGACSTPPTTGALALIAPIYDCGTGGITFKTTGGDGSTITYFAPGITGPTTNPNQFVDAGLRQAADAQPLTLSATQSGVTATYRFDLRATCPIGPTPPPQTNPDRAILVELYNSTNGPGWYRKTNWLQGDSPCNWYGVTCDGNGRVTELGLSKDNLTGTLPASIGNLSRLRILALLENKLSGNIPASLGNLVDVQYIFLDNNQFSGSIPASLGNLSEALFLELSNNQLSGSIPSELSNLPNLVSLLLFNNQLTGSIPANLGSLPNLTSLDLSGNQLSGSIPASLGSSKQLSKLTLSNNKLSGCFPAELASLCGKNISMSNNPGLPGNGDFASFCSNRSGACVTPPTTGNLALTAPTYNCATGAITFNTTGGDGSTITYQAPGIIRSSLTSNTGTIEQGLRNDPKPITIQATQSGKTTSYSFDFGAFCKKDDIRLFGVDTTFFVSTYFDYKVGEVTTDQSNPIERWSKTVTNLPPGIYYNFRLLDDLKTYGLYIFGSKDNRIGSFPITITVVNPLYPNLPVSRNLTLTFKSRNPTTGLTLIEPTYNCATGAFRFNTVGGNGTAIEYTAAGITGWTTNPNQFVDQDSRTANDVKPFFLVARQGGTVVNYLWDLKQACGRARVAAEEAGTTLSLQLLGNPVHETVQVLIKGAEGQPVQLRLTDVRGRLLESRVIEQASAQEVQQFKLDPSTGPGMLFLQATKQQQTHTVKIICQ